MDSLDPPIQVFIPTYNRPDYFLVALDSVLVQDFNNFTVVVSDNSTDDETEKRMQKVSDSRLQYIRRRPSLPPLTHFKTILSEVASEYFMIFHDDDIMEPNCLKTLSKRLDSAPGTAAVAGNASVFWNDNKFTSGKCLKKTTGRQQFSSPDELAKIYLLFGEIAPFPSYMYRKSKVSGLIADPAEGGQNSDVSFLMKILQRGDIVWENQCVMRYRKHSGQDSQGANVKDLMELLRYIRRNTRFDKKDYEVRYFRHKVWAGKVKNELAKSGGKFTSKRLKRIYCAVFRFSRRDIFLKLFIWRFWYYLKRIKNRSEQEG